MKATNRNYSKAIKRYELRKEVKNDKDNFSYQVMINLVSFTILLLVVAVSVGIGRLIF